MGSRRRRQVDYTVVLQVNLDIVNLCSVVLYFAWPGALLVQFVRLFVVRLMYTLVKNCAPSVDDLTGVRFECAHEA